MNRESETGTGYAVRHCSLSNKWPWLNVVVVLFFFASCATGGSLYLFASVAWIPLKFKFVAATCLFGECKQIIALINPNTERSRSFLCLNNDLYLYLNSTYSMNHSSRYKRASARARTPWWWRFFFSFFAVFSWIGCRTAFRAHFSNLVDCVVLHILQYSVLVLVLWAARSVKCVCVSPLLWM